MKVLAIDPGNEESAYVVLDSSIPKILDKGKLLNVELIKKIQVNEIQTLLSNLNAAVIEMYSSYGMPVGQTSLDTCVWIGIYKRQLDLYRVPTYLVFRRTIKLHHCGSVTAGDSNVVKALINKYGQDNTKKRPNLFYVTPNGTWMNGDIWSALALATYWVEPKDRPVENLLEGERNKLSKSLW